MKMKSDQRLWSTARPRFVFESKRRILGLFLFLDFLIYLDRGIVPGSHNEFAEFLSNHSQTARRNPEACIGILQSVFIGGLAIVGPTLSHLATTYRNPITFLSLGLIIWTVSSKSRCEF